MDWSQFVIFIIAMGGIFWWFRGETKVEIAAMNTHIDAMKANTTAEILAWRAETKAEILSIRELIAAMHQEMKDFHGRLIAIETRNSLEKKQK